MDEDEVCFDMHNLSLGYGDGGDSDFALDVDIPSPHDLDTEAEEYWHEVLTIDELVQHQRQIIDEINDVLQLPPTTVRILLNHFKWDKEKLLEKYYDGNIGEIFKDAQVMNPFEKVSDSNIGKVSQNHPEECGICFSLLSFDSMTGLECGHRFCMECWDGYLTSKIVTDGLGDSITCAGIGCKILVDDVTVTKLVHDANVKVKYQQQITKSFVACNRLLRWCPFVDCTYAIKVASVEPRPVRCKCKHIFCYVCGENWHDPVKCLWLKKWIEKGNADEETSKWIATNTKECPKCHVLIEKNGGCNHMTCKSQNCKYEFCWVCLGSWSQHNNHGSCNRYHDEESRSARDAQETSYSSLMMYYHYFERYMNHMHSLEFENKLYATVEQKMKKMHQQDISWVEVQFLKKAADILCQCRQRLMYTYVFAYYTKKNNQWTIFENNQKDLEFATEDLSMLLEGNWTLERYAELKERVKYKSMYCESRSKVLLDHVYEGYEKDWWGFTE